MANRQPCIKRASLATLAALLLACSAHINAQTSKHAWTANNVGTGLHSVNQAVTVTYRPLQNIPRGAVITQVVAAREYTGQADVQTSLCWSGTHHCVDIIGRSISTRAFNGQDASEPLYLVHRLRAQRDSPAPLHVKGSVTVWYEMPPRDDTNPPPASTR